MNPQKTITSFLLLAQMIASPVLADSSSQEIEWHPDWMEYRQKQALTAPQVRQILAGRWESTHILRGWSNPREAEAFTIDIKICGDLELTLPPDPQDEPESNESEKTSLSAFLTLNQEHGSGIAGCASRSSSSNEKSAREPCDGFLKPFRGIAYISRDKNEIMFGNDLEIDGGPAYVLRRTPIEKKMDSEPGSSGEFETIRIESYPKGWGYAYESETVSGYISGGQLSAGPVPPVVYVSSGRMTPHDPKQLVAPGYA